MRGVVLENFPRDNFSLENLWWVSLGAGCPVCMSGFPCQDYKSLHAAITISVIEVNTHTYTDRRILNMMILVLAELKRKGVV